MWNLIAIKKVFGMTKYLGPVAQGLEQGTHNLFVAGSIPARPTTIKNHQFFPVEEFINAYSKGVFLCYSNLGSAIFISFKLKFKKL